MPRYFFNVTKGNEISPDREGSELPSEEYAREEAVAIVAELCRHTRLHRPSQIKVEVRDEFDEPLTVARLTIDPPRL
jgi:hypothetical protein